MSSRLAVQFIFRLHLPELCKLTNVLLSLRLVGILTGNFQRYCNKHNYEVPFYAKYQNMRFFLSKTRTVLFNHEFLFGFVLIYV